MAAYNAQEYLDESIESILNQTYENFEFIIINDGSTDGTLKIIKNYMLKDCRIILISQDNHGLPYSLNTGINVAKGKYIARMDADDISILTRLGEQVCFMEASPEIGVCGTWAEVFGTESRTIKHPLHHNELKARLLFNVCFAHPSVMIRREVLQKHNISYDLEYVNSQDYKLWSELVDVTKFANIPKVLLKYRSSSTSITSITDKCKLALRYELLSNIFTKTLDEINLDEVNRNNKLHFILGLKDRIQSAEPDYKEINKYFNCIVKANAATKYFDGKSLKRELSFRFISVFYFNIRKINFSASNALLSRFFYFDLLMVIKRRFFEDHD
tara:strand:- start:5681 stop:6667 length:987 start_codon:yes stop_codon:yes gene_type:complete